MLSAIKKCIDRGDYVNEPLIPKGYIIIARIIRESPTWQSLNAYHRLVLLEILLQAQHKPQEVARNGEKILLDKGQLATSYQMLANDINLKEITPKVVRGAVNKLEKLGFLVKDEGKARAKKGLLITVVNWGLYQTGESYESKGRAMSWAKQGQSKGKARAINNNDKNVKNDKKYIYAHFENFWAAYPKKKSKGDAEKAWNKINPNEELFNKIMAGIEKGRASPDWKREQGKFIPYPATWLNSKGWEDEYEVDKGEEEPKRDWGWQKTKT